MSAISVSTPVLTRPVRVADITVVGTLGHRPAALLREHGHAVCVDSAPEYAKLAHCDLLVLALGQPEPPAWKLLPHLRERSSVPVMAVTSPLTAAEHQRLLDAGAEACVDADGSDEELLRVVGTLLDAGAEACVDADGSDEELLRAVGTLLDAP